MMHSSPKTGGASEFSLVLINSLRQETQTNHFILVKTLQGQMDEDEEKQQLQQVTWL